jgi:hypothetical protein
VTVRQGIAADAVAQNKFKACGVCWEGGRRRRKKTEAQSCWNSSM